MISHRPTLFGKWLELRFSLHQFLHRFQGLKSTQGTGQWKFNGKLQNGNQIQIVHGPGANQTPPPFHLQRLRPCHSPSSAQPLQASRDIAGVHGVLWWFWDGNNVWIRCAMVMIVQLKSERITYPSCRTAVSNGVTRTHEAKLWQRYCLHPKRASFTSSSSIMIHPLPAFWIVRSVSASRALVASQKQFHAKLMSNTAMHLSSSVLIKK